MVQQRAHTTGVLIGRKAITAYLNISKDTFYDLIKMGLPAAVINQRYYAHVDNIELWFAMLTKQQTRTPQEDID